MRVIAGVHGGRRLRVPHGRVTRPTSDRVREALFSTLGGRVVGAQVLDLFAGSGALGIEAASRGAAHVTFVERDHRVAEVLRGNLEALGIEATTHVGDAAGFIARLDPQAEPVFDLVLCDPPYTLSSAALARLLVGLVGSVRLHAQALVIAERARHSEPPMVPEQELHVADVRTYGDTVLYYIGRGPAGPAAQTEGP